MLFDIHSNHKDAIMFITKQNYLYIQESPNAGKYKSIHTLFEKTIFKTVAVQSLKHQRLRYKGRVKISAHTAGGR